MELAKRVFMRGDAGCPQLEIVLACAEADGSVAPFSSIWVGGAEDMAFRKATELGRITGLGNNIEVLDVVGRPMLVVPVGKRANITPDKLRDAAANACAYLRSHPKLPDTAAIHIGAFEYSWQGKAYTAADLIADFNLGFGLRNDSVQRSKRLRAKERDVQSLCFTCAPYDQSGDLTKMVVETDKKVELAKWIRVTGNMRGSECTPTVLIKRACALLAELGARITVRQLTSAFYKQERFGAFLAVNKGSLAKPAGLTAHYNCGIAGAKTIVLIGKAVTYDTGGLNLKPEDHMLRMYQDKHAAVNDIALFYFLAWSGAPFNVILMVNATENMISSSGTKPGDIITTRGGRQIEDRNTDAEGRLTLDDGIDYCAQKFRPNFILINATLTGHVIQVFGGRIGLFTSDALNPLQVELYTLISQAGFHVWPLPVVSEHADAMDFGECDGTNVDLTKKMGCGTAFLYLKGAVDVANERDDTSAVLEHSDMAGAMRHEATKGWRLEGASVDSFLMRAYALPRRKDFQPEVAAA